MEVPNLFQLVVQILHRDHIRLGHKSILSCFLQKSSRCGCGQNVRHIVLHVRISPVGSFTRRACISITSMLVLLVMVLKLFFELELASDVVHLDTLLTVVVNVGSGCV